MTFASAPDYETKSIYTEIVTVFDGVNTATQNIIIKVNNLNDSTIVITSSSNFNADENQTSIGTVTATDADGDTITFSISGSEINIDSSTGVMTFVTAPDYETKSFLYSNSQCNRWY
jgi:serralysin